MAQSRRSVVIDPTDVHWAHAQAARVDQAASTTDLGRTHHDHAASAHETAARLRARAPELRERAAKLRAVANEARSRRHPRFDVAEHYDGLAEQAERSATACEERAEHHYQLGLTHSATGREHEINALNGIELEDGEDHAAAVLRVQTDAAAEMVVASPDDTEFRTAAQLRDLAAQPKRARPTLQAPE